MVRWDGATVGSYRRLVSVVHFQHRTFIGRMVGADSRLVNLIPSSKAFSQMFRRTYSAPIIPETTFFGSRKRGSFGGACISLTG